MSLRRRLLLAGIVVVVVLFVADVALAVTFRTFLLGRLDEQLTEAAQRVADAPARPPPDAPPGAPPRSANPAFSEYFIAITDASGVLIERLGDPLSTQAEDVPELDADVVVAQAARDVGAIEPFIASSADGERWRMVALRTDDERPIVLIGGALTSVDVTYLRMVAVLAVATGAVLAALLLVAWWLLRHGVHPLAAMTITAEAIADGALSERVPAMDSGTEAGRLGEALNTMLGRIEDAFRERAASEHRLRRFVADASHELRTPLTSVRGYAELYRAGGLADKAALADAMRRIEQEAGRMHDLVEDLLLLAKLDEGRPLQQRPVRLDQIAADAVRDAQAVEPLRSITCQAEPVEIIGDDARMRQALANLLANARAHTPANASVEVTLRREGQSAVIEVADQGPGMTPEVADRVFERFFRADPARTRASGGSGLGLAIVASITQAHRGTAEVDSEPGAGARFRLRLPLHATPAHVVPDTHVRTMMDP